MQTENPESSLACKYCGGELRPLDTRSTPTDGLGGVVVHRTHECPKCGAGLTNRQSPDSGDCVLEIPREYAFALRRFLKRIALLYDSDDELIWGKPSDLSDLDEPPCDVDLADIELRCSTLDPSYREDWSNHTRHGDCLNLWLCSCTSISIFFDGHIIERQSLERMNSFEPDGRVRLSVDHLDSFSDLRHKLDSLFFESLQFTDVQDLISSHFYLHSERERPYFCSNGQRWGRVTHFRILGDLDYPERYTVFDSSDTED